MNFVSAVFGFMILLVGRQFYPLYVGATFFLASAYLIDQVWGTPRGFQAVWVPLLFGLMGGGLTMELRRWIARLAVLLGGAYVFMTLPPLLGILAPQHWAFYLLGGLIFLAFSVVFFDVTLIVLSMLTGAALILRAVDQDPTLNLALLVLICLFSLIAQLVLLRYGQRTPD
jgi:hypothetical protein